VPLDCWRRYAGKDADGQVWLVAECIAGELAEAGAPTAIGSLH
jgi:hypothetical protein